MRALVIEDEEEVAAFNKRVLELEGFAVTVVSTVEDGQRATLAEHFEIIVTDLLLPDGHGLSIVDAVRARGTRTPILVLTGVGEVETTVRALDHGADDYLHKPYEIEELRARVRALMRRGDAGGEVTRGDVSLDRLMREVTVNEQRVTLTPKEFTLLEFLMTHSGEFIDRPHLLKGVWRMDFDPTTNVVDVSVGRLRAKLRAAGAKCSIEAERGLGYRFTEG
jgi:DNA-binding response OmpR family regulator